MLLIEYTVDKHIKSNVNIENVCVHKIIKITFMGETAELGNLTEYGDWMNEPMSYIPASFVAKSKQEIAYLEFDLLKQIC